MKVIKVPPHSFEKMVKAFGKTSQFVRLPSSNKLHVFTGLIMTNGAWVAWPDNLTDTEEKLYVHMYGQPPDIFDPDWENKHKFTPPSKRAIDETKDEPTQGA